jgi:hypothetical protein
VNVVFDIDAVDGFGLVPHGCLAITIGADFHGRVGSFRLTRYVGRSA